MQRSCKGLRVLVVDDNRDNVDSLSMLVREFGADVMACYGGELAVAAAHGFQPHVVLLDLAMPQVDGFAIGRELRASPGMEDCKIIAVTGLAPSVVNGRMADSGLDLVLRKPIEPQLLYGLLVEAMARSLAFLRGRTLDDDQ
jgi:CheY-like chemotaxis protein